MLSRPQHESGHSEGEGEGDGFKGGVKHDRRPYWIAVRTAQNSKREFQSAAGSVRAVWRCWWRRGGALRGGLAKEASLGGGGQRAGRRAGWFGCLSSIPHPLFLRKKERVWQEIDYPSPTAWLAQPGSRLCHHWPTQGPDDPRPSRRTRPTEDTPREGAGRREGAFCAASRNCSDVSVVQTVARRGLGRRVLPLDK